MLKRTLVLLSCTLLLVAVYALAEQQTVVLKSGQTITGDVSRVEGGYQVKTKFGLVTYPADQVTSIGAPKDIQKEYTDQLSKIDKSDAGAHVGLARWAAENGALDIAQSELETALKLKPDNERASLLLRSVKLRISEQQANAAAAKTPTATNAAPSPSATTTNKGDYVSDEDIYRIRLYELKKDDNVSIELRNDVLTKFLKKMKGTKQFEDPNAESQFRALPNIQKVQYMNRELDLDDPLRADILIKSDPKAIKEFRTNVWPTIAQSCGQTKCHGAPGGKGEFKLFNVPGQNDKVDYTNFLILSLWEKHGTHLIDRGNTKDSLVLQHGLPPEAAKYGHPKPITTLFANDKAAQYVRIADWLRSLNGATSPDYHTSYQPPVGRKLGSSLQELLGTPSTAPAKDSDGLFKK